MGAFALAIPALSKAGSILGSILGQQHAKAVAAEAGDLNRAVPQYQANLTAIVAAYNSGQIDASTAAQAVDESVSEYYSAVSSIIKDNSNHGAACSDLDAQGKGNNCNGPCTVGCAWIVPWANRVKAALQTGAGTLSFGAIPAHAGFNGLPAWSLTFAASPISQTTTHTGLSVNSQGFGESFGSAQVATILPAAAAPLPQATNPLHNLNPEMVLLFGFGFSAIALLLLIPPRKA